MEQLRRLRRYALLIEKVRREQPQRTAEEAYKQMEQMKAAQC